ncbi:hypothetical protein [Sediminitomix flava]|uniref:Uncharacterized protein n=1 Tax=Sediminitomix flava TaxID=379075 RepID=A0A315ZAS7_SEDFL|nr:hypothetical protein [Sediminitomix flava]PWJ42696.1 hypothetical protein BC781_102241 [Sediminitomix flava]
MKTNQQNFFWKFLAISQTLVLLYFIFTGFKPDTLNPKFEEITVERINVVEKDGLLKMVISNAERQHPGMIDGKVLFERSRPAGMIFFNEEQDEVGGLIFGGNKEQGSNFALSIDEYKNDQIMQMSHYTNGKGQTSHGIKLWDKDKNFNLPRLLHCLDSLTKLGMSQQKAFVEMEKLNGGPISSVRMFVGKKYNKSTGLFIRDELGNERIRIYVDEKNQPQMEFLDEEGKVLKNLNTEL